MSVRIEDGMIRLEGACRVEDAEPLAAALLARVRPVDITTCATLHAAVLQVLLAFQAPLTGKPATAFLRDHLAPALRRRFAEQAQDATNDGPLGYGMNASGTLVPEGEPSDDRSDCG
jgi:hypothetical protein